MAVDASDTRMGRILIGRKLGLHHGVASFTAELDGLHLFNRKEGRGTKNHGIQSGQNDDDRPNSPHVGIVEIQPGEIRELFLGSALSDQLPTTSPHPDRDLDQAKDENDRQDDVGEEPDIGVVEPAPELRDQKDEDQETREGREHNSGDRDGVVGVVEKTTEEFPAFISARCHASPKNCGVGLETFQ